MNIFPPYFSKLCPQIALINWDTYISKIENMPFKNFDKILIKYSLNEKGKYDCWFLQVYKGEFIRRFETLDSSLLDDFEFKYFL
jgi:hypothetical protein